MKFALYFMQIHRDRQTDANASKNITTSHSQVVTTNSISNFFNLPATMIISHELIQESICIRRFVCLAVCPLIARERVGRLSPNFQGSSGE